MFFKIRVLRNFAIFTRKHLCWSLFLIQLQSRRTAPLVKRDSNRGIFLDNLKEMRGPFPKKILKVPISIYFFEFQGASQSEDKKIETDSR